MTPDYPSQRLANRFICRPRPPSAESNALRDIGVITSYPRCYQSYGTWLRFIGLCCGGMDKHTAERFYEFEGQIKNFDGVVSCSVVTGLPVKIIY